MVPFSGSDQLLGKITKSAFLSSPVSGEKRDPSLLQSQAPGCPPWLGAAVLAANACGPCLCGCLLSKVPVERLVVERGQLCSISPCLESPHFLWHFLAGFPTESGLVVAEPLVGPAKAGHTRARR